MDFDKLINWIKLSSKQLTAIAVATGLLLFPPKGFVDALGLIEIIDKYRPWVGLLFLLSISLLSADLLPQIILKSKKFFQQQKSQRMRHQRLHNLTKDEKVLLNSYLQGDTRTLYLRLDDGVVKGLENEGIIYQASTAGGAGFSFQWAYNIQPWAWKYLKNNLDILSEVHDESYDPDNLLRKL